MNAYKAPWGKTLVWISTTLTALCIGAGVVTPILTGAITSPAMAVVQWLPLAILAGCLPFVIRGYVITDDAILIRRLFWTTRLERGLLKSAEVLPLAMRGSIRTCGNGGGYSITGWYWNKRLGFYRAFVTDLNRTVVLRFRTRTVVLSPDEPADFVRTLGFPSPSTEVA